jgi:predicted nucleic acid-binding protein
VSAKKDKASKTTERPVSAFWDTSGIVPLCCFQSQSSQASRTARLYSRQIAWWATPVEAAGAFNRLYREKSLTSEGRQQALNRLAYLRQQWNEIQPSDEIRDTAERLLNVHKLSAADALQLSAALVWCNHRPRGRHFIGAGGDLTSAAEAEGFRVIHLL